MTCTHKELFHKQNILLSIKTKESAITFLVDNDIMEQIHGFL